jgi:23S rRNA pseudouridine1911/1915/1917 synthase
VHRLDKDTTGLLVVAKTLTTQHHLVQQLQARSVSRIYDAAVYGSLTRSGKVDQPIGRHTTQRTKMAIRPGGKPAITHYKVVQNFGEHSHIELALETGRTHQIRVHMQSISHPLIGDNTYGGGFKEPAHKDSGLLKALREFKRPALHARELRLIHPATEEEMHWCAEIPVDMQTLLDDLMLYSSEGE